MSSFVTLFLARNFFPVEKKIRHEIKANYAIGDDVFVRTMGHLLGPPLVEGNKLTPLENGDILLLHDGHAARTRGGAAVILEVLPRLLDTLQSQGLATVTLRAVPAMLQ